MNGRVGTFDVVVVGARCAGATLAALLAGRGLSVCLLDRARFPSDTLSTHVIWPSGVAVLDELGLSDAIKAVEPVPLTEFTLLIESVRIDATVSRAGEGRGPALCIRRFILDDLLVGAAAAAGAHVSLGTKVRDVIFEQGRAVGVTTSAGAVRARLVVGADGRRSTVATRVGAAKYGVEPAGRLTTWGYFESASDYEGRLRAARIGEMGFISCPGDSGLYVALVCPPMAKKHPFLSDREKNYAAAIHAWPELHAILAGARRVGPIRAMLRWDGYFREAAGPGWVLLGDAGHFKDPVTAQGMSDAFRQAKRLADAIVIAFSGSSSVDHAMSRWWRWRDRDSQDMYWLAADAGSADPLPRLALEVARDIGADSQARERLVQVLNHELRPSELLNESRFREALTRTAREHPEELPAIVREMTSVLGAHAQRVRDRLLLFG
jgi:flavin-dependent dehydrogenase